MHAQFRECSKNQPMENLSILWSTNRDKDSINLSVMLKTKFLPSPTPLSLPLTQCMSPQIGGQRWTYRLRKGIKSASHGTDLMQISLPIDSVYPSYSLPSQVMGSKSMTGRSGGLMLYKELALLLCIATFWTLFSTSQSVASWKNMQLNKLKLIFSWLLQEQKHIQSGQDPPFFSFC